MMQGLQQRFERHGMSQMRQGMTLDAWYSKKGKDDGKRLSVD
jgi:hypothetical protein